MPRTTPRVPRQHAGRQDVALFSKAADIVDFDTVLGAAYAPGTNTDALNGGDTVLLPSDAGRAATAGLAPGTAVRGGRGADRLTGRDLADNLSGDAGADVLVGGGGADTLAGGNKADRLAGGDGADRLRGDGGRDTLAGDADADTLDGGAAADELDGGDGDDQLLGGGKGDTLFGGAGADTLDGQGGRDRLHGADGNDLLRGGNGRDRLAGDAGDDTLEGGKGADALEGGAGRDVLAGGAAADHLFGGAGDDDLDGGTGRDVLRGGADAGRVLLATASLGGSLANADWFDPGVLARIGQSSALGSYEITSTADADWSRFAAPENYAGARGGIGIWSGAGGPNNRADGANPEINSGTGDTLNFGLATDAVAASLQLSLFFDNDDFAGSGRLETASLVLRHAGSVVAAFTVDALGEVVFSAGAGRFAVRLETTPGLARDGGYATLTIGGATRFDEIALSAAPITTGDLGGVSDFAVTGLSVTLDRVAGSFGGDVLSLGADANRDVVQYGPAGDGVDTIRQFDVGKDRLVLEGVTAEAVRFAPVGDDTWVTFDGFDPTIAALHFEGARPTLADFDFV